MAVLGEPFLAQCVRIWFRPLLGWCLARLMYRVLLAKEAGPLRAAQWFLSIRALKAIALLSYAAYVFQGLFYFPARALKSSWGLSWSPPPDPMVNRLKTFLAYIIFVALCLAAAL